MKKEDIRSGVAEILRSLREKQGYSKNRMAERLGINKRTWYAWESGETVPNIAEFIRVFTECGESMLRPILQLFYPDQYGTNTDQIREQLTHFIQTAATDHQIDVLSFLAFGSHGSNFAPQVELFCAYNHLPLEQRFFIAEMVYQQFMIAQNRGDLIKTADTMPDMKTWETGLKAGQKAAYKRLQSYTTITED